MGGYFNVWPFWINNSTKVNEFLTENYPNDSWEIERFDKIHPAGSPYIIVIRFSNNPEKLYLFQIDKNGKINKQHIVLNKIIDIHSIIYMI
jgi:hypothetical protein